jgi:23S rRNA (guanosine2251-2'-O)-methyltransferase
MTSPPLHGRTGGNGPEWVVGFHAVLAALERGSSQTEVVWLAEGVSGGRAQRIVESARRARVRFTRVPRRELDEIAAGVAHNGFAARLSPVAFSDPGGVLEAPPPSCVIGLDSLEDPHNLGAVVRTAAGLGLSGVVVSGPHPPPLGGATAKVAAGTLPLVRVARVAALGDFVREARRAGFWAFGADPAGTPLDRVEMPERTLLCLGSEAGGLRAKTRSALDEIVAIPLVDTVESLNLSVAAALLAWEWRRSFPLPDRAPGNT